MKLTAKFLRDLADLFEAGSDPLIDITKLMNKQGKYMWENNRRWQRASHCGMFACHLGEEGLTKAPKPKNKCLTLFFRFKI